MRMSCNWAAYISNIRKHDPPISNALAQVEWVEDTPIPIGMAEIREIFKPPLFPISLDLSPPAPGWKVRVRVIRRECDAPESDHFEFFGAQRHGVSTAPVKVPAGPSPALGSQFILYLQGDLLTMAVPLKMALQFDSALKPWLDEVL